MATKRRTQPQWQQLIEQWKQTDETIANFCVQHGLNQASFYNWRAPVNPARRALNSPRWKRILIFWRSLVKMPV
ncbi:IS66 family insertion sequence element accessory protein TnpA [Klebsiella variicola]|uniref:IS66 family insertion sequence element accessory protein TnpA n=1 Tax=Klebsiella pneumoniae complex TaxID=3390273 RepID=UPI00396B3142